jgi:integrase
MTPAYWTPIANFVIQCALDTQPPTTVWAKMMLRTLSRYVHWATHVALVPLDRDGMFHRPASVHKMESLLHRVGEALGDDETTRRVKVAPRETSPYPNAAVPALFSWANSRHTTQARCDSWAVLGFCGGVGARTNELLQLRVRDVTATEIGLLVAIPGEHARVIAVRDGWENAVRRAIAGKEPEEYVLYAHLPQNSRTRALTHFARSSGGRCPSPTKLRTTWIAAIVNVLPLGSALYAAGFTTPSSLRPYLPHTSVPKPSDLHPLLRGIAGTE